MSDRDDLARLLRRFGVDFFDDELADSDLVSIDRQLNVNGTLDFYFDSVTGRFEKIEVSD